VAVVAARRAVRARSSSTAAVAAARAAAIAMRVICQPGIPPVTIVRTGAVEDMAAPRPYPPSESGIGMIAAEAAGTAAAQSSTPTAMAARTAVTGAPRVGAQPGRPAGSGCEHSRLLLFGSGRTLRP
jgi:hypothetical protein